LVLPDLVVTVFVDEVAAFGAASAGVAMIARAATELINFFIQFLLVSRQRCAGDGADRRAQISVRLQQR
jgi:hypothetical protein